MIMKKKIVGSFLVLILFMQVLVPTVLGAQSVELSEATTKASTNEEGIQFEDENLKNLLINDKGIDKDSDGIITASELETLTELTIATQVNSLKGLENAKNLTTLKIATDDKYTFSENFFDNMTSLKSIDIATKKAIPNFISIGVILACFTSY